MAEVIVSFKAELDGFQAELKKAEQSVFSVDNAANKAANDTAKSFNDAAKKVTQSTKEIEKGVKDAFNGKSLDAFIKEATKSGQSISELKKSLKDLKSAALSVDANSEAFRKLTKAAGQVTDEVGDLNQRIKNLASDTQRLDALINVGQGIAGGFALAQGGMALFGAESEDLQKTLVKLQAAQNVMNGMQQVANVLNKDSAASTFLAGSAQKAYSLAVGTSTGALKAFRLALVSTGIGALIVGLGLLISNWEKVKDAIGGVIDKLKVFTDKIPVLSGLLNALSSSSKSLSERMEEQSMKIKEQIALYDAQGKSQKEIIELKKQEIKARAIAAMAIKDEKERIKELSNIKIEYLGLIKEGNEAEKKSIEDLEKKRKEAWEKEQKRRKEESELAEAVKEYEKKTLEDILGKREEVSKELNEIPLFDENIIEEDVDALVYNYQKTLEGQLSLFEAQRKNLKNEYDNGIIDYEQYQQQLTEINNREIDLRNQKKQTELQVATEVTQSLLALNKFILGKTKEGAEIAKALALFQIGIDTAKAISTITAEMAKGNLTPIEYGLKVASGIAIVTQNMVRAKNLLNQDVPQFAEGTERVTGGKRGVDSVPAVLMPDEAVIKAKENMRYFGLSKAWNAGKLEDYIKDRWVLPALVNQQRLFEANQQKSLANNIAQSIYFNDRNLIKAHKAGMRTQWETTEYLARVIKKSKRNPYSPLN